MMSIRLMLQPVNAVLHPMIHFSAPKKLTSDHIIFEREARPHCSCFYLAKQLLTTEL